MSGSAKGSIQVFTGPNGFGETTYLDNKRKVLQVLGEMFAAG